MLEGYTPRNSDEAKMVEYICGVTSFTYDDLLEVADLSIYKRQSFVSHLMAVGRVIQIEHIGRRKAFTVLTRQRWRRLRAEQRKSAPGLMWTAMRRQKVFGPAEILSFIEASSPLTKIKEVKRYCSDLQVAGYLKVEKKARADGRMATYRLVRDTGPLPPVIRSLRCVVDGNTDKVAYVAGDRL